MKWLPLILFLTLVSTAFISETSVRAQDPAKNIDVSDAVARSWAEGTHIEDLTTSEREERDQAEADIDQAYKNYGEFMERVKVAHGQDEHHTVVIYGDEVVIRETGQ